MNFQLDDAQVADGTVLLFGIRYVNDEYQDRERYSKTFTYAALKAGGRWYLTGTGRVPQDAGWGAVARWLDDPRREVVWVRVVTRTTQLWPDDSEPEREESMFIYPPVRAQPSRSRYEYEVDGYTGQLNP